MLSTQHLLAILTASQLPKSWLARLSPYQTLATPNNEHILLCLVLRTVPANWQTVTVLVIPKDQGHPSERVDMPHRYPIIDPIKQGSHHSQECVHTGVHMCTSVGVCVFVLCVCRSSNYRSVALTGQQGTWPVILLAMFFSR